GSGARRSSPGSTRPRGPSRIPRRGQGTSVSLESTTNASRNMVAIELISLLRALVREETEAILREREQIKRIPKDEQLVYLIQGETGGPIKIGIARNPKKRLGELQATSPVRLRILRTLTGGLDREREIHLQLAQARLHGEWFDDAHADVVEF